MQWLSPGASTLSWNQYREPYHQHTHLWKEHMACWHAYLIRLENYLGINSLTLNGPTGAFWMTTFNRATCCKNCRKNKNIPRCLQRPGGEGSEGKLNLFFRVLCLLLWKEMVWTLDHGLGSLNFLDFHRRQILSWESIKVFSPWERIIDPLGKPWIRTEYWTRRKRMSLVMCQLRKTCLGLQKIWTWPEFQIQYRDVSAAPCNGANVTNPLRRQDSNVSRILPLPTNTRPPKMARIETKRTKTIHP